MYVNNENNEDRKRERGREGKKGVQTLKYIYGEMTREEETKYGNTAQKGVNKISILQISKRGYYLHSTTNPSAFGSYFEKRPNP